MSSFKVVLRKIEGDQEKSLSGKKFESPEKLNFFFTELFFLYFFFLHMELGVIHMWQATHFKVYSKKIA